MPKAVTQPVWSKAKLIALFNMLTIVDLVSAVIDTSHACTKVTLCFRPFTDQPVFMHHSP